MAHDAAECRTASVLPPETPRRSSVRRPSEVRLIHFLVLVELTLISLSPRRSFIKAFMAMTLDRLQASSGFGDKMLDGEGIKSPEVHYHPTF